MNYETLSIDIQGAIAHVQLNRPGAYNSMNRAFWNEFPEAITSLDRSGEIRVIVLSSTGKHFTAGMDTSIFTDPESIPFNGEPSRVAENLRRVVLDLQDAFNVMERARMPVLAAIQGGCIGGGVDMISAADCRYCTEDAFFTIKETDLGMTADVGTLQRLPHLIPQGMIRELAFTGRKLGAEEAKAIGLVNHVYQDQTAMLAGVMDIAEQIAERSPLAVHGCKEMINYTRDHTVADSLNYIATWQAGMFRQTDVMKAFAAKAQKVSADYENLYPREKALKQNRE
ncbi:MAG: crotonase/enoyl-CoA hydratase family protein [Ketobacteraceae bacterium]|nr:crotonase/enoyl-CoA hydratase family protein [Ketobacteraceae bacterium]